MESQLPVPLLPLEGPLPAPCDAYLASAAPRSEVIREVECL